MKGWGTGERLFAKIPGADRTATWVETSAAAHGTRRGPKLLAKSALDGARRAC